MKEMKVVVVVFGMKELSRCEICGWIEGRNKVYGIVVVNVCVFFKKVLW